MPSLGSGKKRSQKRISSLSFIGILSLVAACAAVVIRQEFLALVDKAATFDFTTPVVLKDNILQLSSRDAGAESIWSSLLQEGAAAGKSNTGIAMEVGMFNPGQCLEAARAGFQAHCLEPSPSSFERVEYKVSSEKDTAAKERVHLYQVAAGEREGTVPFVAAGSTGDHVGDYNMWKMKANTGETIPVPMKRLDDIIRNTAEKNVFVLKIDTQGFEAAVFRGLTDTIQHQRVDYILFEYWPKGMDLLAGVRDDKRQRCKAAVTILRQLVQAGYTFYALPVISHPKAPESAREAIRAPLRDRPLDNIEANCQWYYQVEEHHFDPNYNMGYWSDVLAVAPGASFENPITDIGRALKA